MLLCYCVLLQAGEHLSGASQSGVPARLACRIPRSRYVGVSAYGATARAQPLHTRTPHPTPPRRTEHDVAARCQAVLQRSFGQSHLQLDAGHVLRQLQHWGLLDILLSGPSSSQEGQEGHVLLAAVPLGEAVEKLHVVWHGLAELQDEGDVPPPPPAPAGPEAPAILAAVEGAEDGAEAQPAAHKAEAQPAVQPGAQPAVGEAAEVQPEAAPLAVGESEPSTTTPMGSAAAVVPAAATVETYPSRPAEAVPEAAALEAPPVKAVRGEPGGTESRMPAAPTTPSPEAALPPAPALPASSIRAVGRPAAVSVERLSSPRSGSPRLASPKSRFCRLFSPA